MKFKILPELHNLHLIIKKSSLFVHESFVLCNLFKKMKILFVLGFGYIIISLFISACKQNDKEKNEWNESHFLDLVSSLEHSFSKHRWQTIQECFIACKHRSWKRNSKYGWHSFIEHMSYHKAYASIPTASSVFKKQIYKICIANKNKLNFDPSKIKCC